MDVIFATATLGRFHGSSARNSSDSALSLTMSGTRGLPPRSRVSTLVVRHRSDVAVSVPLPANGVANERVQKVRETKNLHPIGGESRGVQSVLPSPRRRDRTSTSPTSSTTRLRSRNVAHATFRLRIPPCTAPSAAFPCSYLFHARSARKTRRNERTTDTPRCPSRLNVTSHSSFGLDVVAAVRDLDDVGEEADDGGEHNLRHHLEHDGILELEYLVEERERGRSNGSALTFYAKRARSTSPRRPRWTVTPRARVFRTRATGVRGGVAETGRRRAGRCRRPCSCHCCINVTLPTHASRGERRRSGGC